VTQRNSARDLIENFMIAANVVMAQYGGERYCVSSPRGPNTGKLVAHR
jgi:hypothetical protein